MAGSVVLTIPIMLLFFAAERMLTEGLKIMAAINDQRRPVHPADPVIGQSRGKE